MAGKSDRKSGTAPVAAGGNGGGGSNRPAGPPAGYRQVTADTDAPWWKACEDAVCHGELLGMYTMQTDPPRNYFQLRLVEPTSAFLGKGKDREEITVEKGQVINLGENFKVQELRKIIPEHRAGARFMVYVRVKGDKIPVGNARTMWPMDIYTKMTKAPDSPVVRAADVASGELKPGEGDEVPF